ncbi:MAG: RES domain-containing protein [Pseudomonadota bacterium]
MTITAWRVVKARHRANAFDGEGARRFGGRWNARGTPMVYVSQSLSLAAFETFVHLAAEDARLSFVSIRVGFPSGVRISELSVANLPADWRAEPPPDDCKSLGSEWAEAAETAILKVPSVIVPHEFNFVLNPRHPDFNRFSVGVPEPFGFDSRMWQ